MWKTLTAKSNWLPVAYHLFQGEKGTLSSRLCVWRTCLFVCEHAEKSADASVDLWEKEWEMELRVRVAVLVRICNARTAKSPSKLTSAPDSSHFLNQIPAKDCERPLAPPTRWGGKKKPELPVNARIKSLSKGERQLHTFKLPLDSNPFPQQKVHL